MSTFQKFTSAARAAKAKKKLMVAAIDFGTTYSGGAFSFETDYESDPTKVSCKNWSSGKHLSAKVPTTVLIKPDGVTLEAFGYEAEDRYSELVDEGGHAPYYFFQRFKMILYENKKLKRNEELEDNRGRRLPAKRVFAMVIRYLKEDLLERSGKNLVTGILDEDEIQWVLTVPAIWNIRAKQFMRESAVEAGIKSSNLMIALEPEVASLYCKHLSLHRQKESPDEAAVLSAFQPGARYMLVDAGGGTIDIIVHEVGTDGSLEELCAANGGNWGGTMLDKAFFDFLTSIVGDNVMTKFKDDHLDDFIDLQREFDVKKRDIEPDQKNKVKLKLPVCLSELYKELYGHTIMDKIKQDNHLNGRISFMADKMLIEIGLMKTLFEKTTKEIVSHIATLIKDESVRGTDTILMVGGFSESAMLYGAVKTAFPNKKVILPQDAGLAVLKGAVIYGHSNKDIRVRVSPYTYGYASYQSFDQSKHPLERKTVKYGEEIVDDIFKILIEKGTKLVPGSTSKTSPACPPPGYSYFVLSVYATKNEQPEYVTDAGCYKLGDLTVDCKDEKGQIGSTKIQFKLGGTEFEVNAMHKTTGKLTTATFEFLD